MFGSDQNVFVPADWNVFLHQAEVVEATDKQPAAAHPQVEVQFLTAVPAHRRSNVRTPNETTCCASAFLLLYLVMLYCTFCVRSTFSMTKSCKWHLLKAWLGGLRLALLLHLRVPNIAYRQILGVSSMCCSTIFSETLV